MLFDSCGMYGVSQRHHKFYRPKRDQGCTYVTSLRIIGKHLFSVQLCMQCVINSIREVISAVDVVMPCEAVSIIGESTQLALLVLKDVVVHTNFSANIFDFPHATNICQMGDVLVT